MKFFIRFLLTLPKQNAAALSNESGNLTEDLNVVLSWVEYIVEIGIHVETSKEEIGWNL